MLLDRFSARTVDSGPVSGHFRCFWPDLKIRSGPNLAPNPQGQTGAWNPQPGLPIPELFSGPHSGTFFCTFFGVFPGNSSNNVDPADPTKFAAFPGNASNYVGSNPDLAFLAKPGMPSLGFCQHYLLDFLEMPQISSGQRGRHYLSNFLEMRQISCRKKFRNGAQKKVPESAGLVGDDLAVP